MLSIDDEDLAAIDPTKPVQVDGLHYIAMKASDRLTVHALNRLAQILLGKERAAQDWTFDDLYAAAADAKLDELERNQ